MGSCIDYTDEFIHNRVNQVVNHGHSMQHNISKKLIAISISNEVKWTS